MVEGERLLAESGTRVVEKLEFRGEEAVYNIEVEGDHCYRVGEQGVLVHNASQPVCVRDSNRASNPCAIPANAYCQSHHVIPCEVWNERAARNIHRCCFDLNGSDNLIKLPCCEYRGRTAAYHRGRTPGNYVLEVRTLLQRL